MNRMVENYLRCYCSYHQNEWDELLPAAEFSYNSEVADDLGMSPFELDLRWTPKSPLNTLSGKEIRAQNVEEFNEKLKASLEDAQYSYKIAKASQSTYSSMKYLVPNYQVGGKVWLNRSLFKDAYAKSQESDKLSARRFGLLIGNNAFKLELPDHIKSHPVVHVSHTIPHKEQPAEIAAFFQSRPEPIQAEEGEEYEVDLFSIIEKEEECDQFQAVMKEEPNHDAEWLSKKSFVDKDGTVTGIWKEYIRREGILPHYH